MPLIVKYSFRGLVKSISLVCTTHAERGRANVSALVAILERIQPQAIFLELPPNAFDQFFNACTKSNLESNAVRRYRANFSVELIPVDLPAADDKDFLRDYERLQTIIDNKSRDSRRLLTWHKNNMRDEGFVYLNSEYCNEMWSDIYADEQTTLKELGDQGLTEISEAWRKKNDLREDEMLKNIHLHCRTTSFERAAFLVGAAHRQSLIEKLQGRDHDSQEGILWDFSCGQTPVA